MTKLLTAAELTAVTRQVEDVEVPELGGTIRLRALSAGDLFTLPSVEGDGASLNYNNVLLARSLIDESGERLFSDDDAGRIAELPARMHRMLLQRVMDMNVTTAAAIEDLEKN